MKKILGFLLSAVPIFLFAQKNDPVYEDSLKRSALYLEPVEVIAIRASENAPFAKSTIIKKDIEKTNLGQDLPYLLNQLPSVVINSDAGNGVGYTGIRIRGSDATRINMTINGIPYNDAESQGLFFVNLPDLASSVNDIQVQRGIGTSSNGAGAFGATMNFSTNEVNMSPYATINNTYGSFNTWKNTVKTGSGLINGHFTIDARLSKLSSDGYIERAATDLHSFYLSGAYLTKKSSLRINVISGKEKTYQAWNGIPESDLENNRTKNYSGTEKPGTPYNNETDNYLQDHFQAFFNHKFSDQLSFNTALFLTPGKGYYENYKSSKTLGDFGLPDFISGSDTVRQTDLVQRLWLDNKYFGQVISLQYKEAKTQFTIGGGWNRYNGHHYGEIPWAFAGVPVDYRWYDLRAHKTDINTYTKLQRNISKGLEIFVDIQYRYINYYLGGFRKNPTLIINNKYNFVNPKLGLSFTTGNNRLYASWSYAAKEPNRDDFEAGATQQPTSEKMHDVEAGYEKKAHNWSASANIYFMKYKDQLIPTGKINDVGAYTRTNIPNSYREGIELLGRISVNRILDIGGNIALSRNKVKNYTEYFDDYDNGGQKSVFHALSDIAFSPDIVGGASINIKPCKNFELNFLSKYVSRQYLDNSSLKSRSLDPYFTEDARMSYTIPNHLFNKTQLILQVNNVFNKKYEANGYTYSYLEGGITQTQNYYFPMAVTNFMFALNIDL
ncbi:MAG: TonB-dependent receptor plug domain-containing protein [Flavitalea sp.]